MINIILIILASALVILCLLQESKNDGILSLTSSTSLKLFQQNKSRGMDKQLSIATAIVGAVFMLLIAYINLAA